MIKKSLIIIIAVFAILIPSCQKYDDAIADIKDRLDKIEGTSIAGIDGQIAAINSSIKDLEHVDVILSDAIFNLGVTLGDLEDDVAQTNKLIQGLQAKDSELDLKIKELKEYTDNCITGTQEWVEGTFATLEQYSAMQTQIASLKVLIETYKTDITASCTKALEDAIAASEDSMKEWVNVTLAEGYYNVAEIDAKLKTLENKLANADADLEKAIKGQQAALEQAKKDLTKAYQDAIKKAIEENNGMINKTIADAVAAALDIVEGKLTTIGKKMEGIEKELVELQNNFARRIQSLTFLPEYSDGKVKMDYTTKTAEIDLLVSPRELVQYISENHLTAYVRITENPGTRAAGSECSIDVMIIEKSKNGVISLEVQDTQKSLSTAFWDGSKGAMLYIQINDGNNQVISQAIPLVAHSYVNEENNVNGFEEGENFTGTVTE